MVTKYTRRDFAALTALATAGVSLAGCQGKAVDKVAEAHKAMMLRMMEAQNSGHIEVIMKFVDETHTEDIVLHDPGRAEPIQGIAAIKQFQAQVFNTDQVWTLEQMVAEGDFVASRLRVHATDDTGKKWNLEIMGFARFVDNKIAEEWQLVVPIEAPTS
jgi:predicted SnoaL-like aldol condensation-catalyzing enzyme